MKTVEQVKEKLKEGFKTDPFGFGSSDLIHTLPFEDAKEYLVEEFLSKEGAKEEWENNRITTDEHVLMRIRGYIPFAQEKIDDERGLSADRSCQHFIAWFWLIDEEFSKKLEDLYNYHYAPYGQPVLDAVKEYMNVGE